MIQFQLKYMVDREGELIGTYATKAEAQKAANVMAEGMHPEQAADLVISELPDLNWD